ncbi:hypothetical protein GCM10010885_21690 [Alicyclobacillus cellulosilyticus]|uniref:Protein-glutamine gamma-glutamyltransferase-like C-terminal domain-containing protein n=1 Tax=Alicyclobacillus cellulosilyticus TaxID=1003997 RepID=A0A917NMG3_9BACL|nr:DUF4129 domain-containing protein [Alicyclobacillus cellulosilyticus]GGJ11970.1 hypothetical protein GCM10010885_21690 [Alicyclobacillus cellulosilyticus]
MAPWRQLAAAVRAAWHAALVWVWQMVAAVFRWLTPPAAPHRVPPQAARPELPPAHASPWAAWLDRVLPWVVVAALCACAVYLLWRGAPRVVRWLRQAVAWLWRRLGREAEPAYVEEVESLPVWRAWADAWRKARVLRRDGRAVWPRWEELPTPAARIRYLYRWLTAQAARKGLPVPPHDTPREAAARIEAAMAPSCPEIPELAHWYNEVRYGERPGDAAAAERLYQALSTRFGESAARGGATRGDARRAPKRAEMRRDRERSGDGIKRPQ